MMVYSVYHNPCDTQKGSFRDPIKYAYSCHVYPSFRPSVSVMHVVEKYEILAGRLILKMGHIAKRPRPQ